MRAVCAFFILLSVTSVYASLDDDWEAFKQEHGLHYDSAEIEQLKKARFEKALSRVNKHNNKHRGKNGAAVMKMHPIGLLSDEEFAQRKLGLNPKIVANVFEVAATPSLTTLPLSFDWRTLGAVTPVKNQKNCGSCWSFSATGALEGAWFKKYGKLISLSEQQLLDCSGSACNGGWMDTAFSFIQTEGGLDTESSYPYTAVKGPSCLYKNTTIGAKCSGYVDVAGDETSIKTALVNKGPLAVAIGVSSGSGLYSTGIFTSSMCVTPINHGVLLVGYGQDTSGNKFWILKNSWGTGWGMAGYFNYPIGSATCVLQYPSYPLVP